MIDCFVEFDRTIVNREVVAELKRIAGKTDEDLEDPEEVAHEVDNLYQEATMPLEDVIAKYEAKESIDEKKNENFMLKPLNQWVFLDRVVFFTYTPCSVERNGNFSYIYF